MTESPNKRVRVRFAPSPTGPLHIGGVRTALYNYLFAKQHGGDFLLRIEDTDRTRFVPGAEEYIREAFRWCGIPFDEGTEEGGAFGPYRQSERRDIYADHIRKLIDSGWAYYAFDTPEEIDAMRSRLQAESAPSQQYDSSTRKTMKNSLTLSGEETEEWLASGKPYVVRFRVPENDMVVIDDLIRGRVEVNTLTLDDKVLLKADGMPTYHLANIVDDHMMQISHVIRGEEWLPSAPLHALLYKAYGWEAPSFAHLPLLLKPEGSGKLSKRDGDRLGFPVFPLAWNDPATGESSMGYREQGYLAPAFLNMLALLGWNPGTEQEIFGLDELIASFSLDRVSKSGARFDPVKARWFNHQYIMATPSRDLLDSFMAVMKEHGTEPDKEKSLRVLELIKERVELLPELWEQASFFFIAPEEYDQKVAGKRWKEHTPALLQDWLSAMEAISWERDPLHDASMAFLESRETGAGQLMNPLRLALVGGAKGPDLFTIIQLLGREETDKRISRAIERKVN